MLFSSIEFVVFFAITYAAFLGLRGRPRARKVLILACSYWFYMTWNAPFVLLLFFSTALDFVAGHRIGTSASQTVRVRWLVASCVGNLGVLAFFKYADFVVGNFWVFMPSTVQYPEFVESIVLPLGISFYTFQSMSYTIDVYRKNREHETNLLDFAIFVTFFPQLIAGPILRSSNFLPQLKAHRYPSSEDVLQGFDQLMRGFAKKVLVADQLAVYVSIVTESPQSFGAFNHMLAVYAFAFQAYFDFSGYSDIAIGAARMMGFRIPANFNLPFISRDPAEVWSRWHISLSSWLRDYLYIPLGGNRRGSWMTYVNLFATMALSGLWHGAGWGYVLWGSLHGIWLVFHRFLVRSTRLPRLPAVLGIFFTFHIWALLLVFFRTQTLEKAIATFVHLFDFSTPIYAVDLRIYALVVLGFVAHLLGLSVGLKRVWEETFVGVKALWYAFVIIAIFFVAGAPTDFIYFQF